MPRGRAAVRPLRGPVLARGSVPPVRDRMRAIMIGWWKRKPAPPEAVDNTGRELAMRDARIELMLEVIDELAAYVDSILEFDGGCDHSVGICNCGIKQDLTRAKMLLAAEGVGPDKPRFFIINTQRGHRIMVDDGGNPSTILERREPATGPMGYADALVVIQHMDRNAGRDPDDVVEIKTNDARS